MPVFFRLFRAWLWLALCLGGFPVHADDQARALVKAALDYWRDTTSHSVAEMVIHRTDWERSMVMEIWTQGDKNSLVRVLEPKKDAGGSTLLKDGEMWSYAPKTGRIIKIPSSMMGQSWMGSDFSNNDIARADKLIEEYTHTLLATETVDGHTVYTIQAVPLENAPVVWGKEVVRIRADYLVLEHAFYDQDQVLLKKMSTREIREMGGKLVAGVQRMENLEKPGEWTEVRLREAQFKVEIADSMFTLSNLSNPRF